MCCFFNLLPVLLSSKHRYLITEDLITSVANQLFTKIKACLRQTEGRKGSSCGRFTSRMSNLNAAHCGLGDF